MENENKKVEQGPQASADSRDYRPSWLPKLRNFERPSAKSVTIQLLDTLPPYIGLLTIMYLLVHFGAPIWLAILLAVPAGGFLIRLFIFFHDCCHGSYLKSKTAMSILGTIIGILTFTPFRDWRHAHGIHHSSAGNLDRRGIGDVWTMTLQEYNEASRWTRFKYRMFRNPLVMFGIGPLFTFVIGNRFAGKYSTKEDRRSILLTNLALLGFAAVMSLVFSVKAYLIVQLSVMYFAGMAGIWLFYVQHQFDPSYWERSEEWESVKAALEGSSYYKLPAVLQWFSGNIGLHHIHHLRTRIPNYMLPKCLKAIPELNLKNPLTLRRSLASVRLNLWDEANKRLISFRAAAAALRHRR